MKEEKEQDITDLLHVDGGSASFANSFHLRFNDALEVRYKRIYARRDRRYVRALLLVLLISYVLYGACDWYLLGDGVAPVWAIRYFVGAPILALLLFFSKARWVERFLQVFIVAGIFTLVITTLLMVGLVGGESVHLYLSSLLAIIMGGLTTTRIQFNYAAFTASLYMLFASIVLLPMAQINPLIMYYLILNFAAELLCLLAVFTYEKMIRREFLQKILIQRKNHELRKANEKLKTLVDNDALTNIANRRYFDQILEQEWRRAKRRGYSLAMLMVDIDYFKAFNDSLGHLEGDRCIQQVAQGLEELVRRPGDLVARYGGEEFAIILPALNVDEAEQLAQAVCDVIQGLEIAHPNSSVASVVTVSVGAAAIVPTTGFSKRDLIAMADEALYLAKSQGRNCTARVIVPQQESLLD
ncbi:MAG: GGDEF domain-containing protein [Pseudomonadales bacterium]|nr:GGDEF domain-containing protein [Pseudomonadales bacterium]